MRCYYTSTCFILGCMPASNSGSFASKLITCKFFLISSHVEIITCKLFILSIKPVIFLLFSTFYFQVWKWRHKIDFHNVDQWDVDSNLFSLGGIDSVSAWTKASTGEFWICRYFWKFLEDKVGNIEKCICFEDIFCFLL